MTQKNIFSDLTGIALYTSRRFIEIYYPNTDTSYLGTSNSRHLEVVPGDIVSFISQSNHIDKNNVTITGIEDRINILKRSFDKKTKNLAANLTELWIVTAPPPLFNPIAIDRTITAAESQGIPVKIIANKNDLLEFREFELSLSHYNNLTSGVITVSALKQDGLEKLKITLSNANLNIIAITGVSGAGKSSLISSLYPETNTKSGIVSEKTGQGKQTTSAAKGYIVENDNHAHLTALIDLPGIQNYGVSHLNSSEIRQWMKDLSLLSQNCKFRNCQHLKEPNCAVLEALANGILPETRYNSYLDMLKEHEQIKEY